MLRKVHIQRFKCLYDVAVDLDPFTILIGPNDSGKSSLVDAIQFLGRLARERPHQVFTDAQALPNVVWCKQLEHTIEWAVEGTARGIGAEFPFYYRLEIAPDGAVQKEELIANGEMLFLRGSDGRIDIGTPKEGMPPHLQVHRPFPGLGVLAQAHASNPAGKIALAVGAALLASAKYRLNPEALREPAVPASDAVLSPSGTNLTAVVDEILTSPDRSARDEMERQLREAIPTLAGVSTKGGAGGKKSLEFTLPLSRRPLVTIPAALASDGAMLLMGVLALAYGNTPDIVFIEEPENGIHYSLLGVVINTLRKMTTGELGPRPRQVIITTHSPLLLNFANPGEVRIFRRVSDGGTRIMPMSGIPNIESLLQEFAPGELWFNLGEDALAKGGVS